jgi:hypothetical protein
MDAKIYPYQEPRRCGAREQNEAAQRAKARRQAELDAAMFAESKSDPPFDEEIAKPEGSPMSCIRLLQRGFKRS